VNAVQDRIELSLLADYYGAFLTENQRELIKLSCDEDLSLSEIAEQKGISRQGVRDSIARGSRILSEMEAKLGLIARDRKAASLMSGIKREIESGEGDASKKLDMIRPMIAGLSKILEGKDGI
jgi:predicted DNA-binding protein YlxM (UPF0122 family)